MRVIRILFCAAVSSILATGASAQTVVYNNGGPDGRSGLQLKTITEANDFTFTSATTFDGIRFWNIQADANPTAGFTWYLETDAGGTPGSVFATGFATAVQQAQGLGCCGFFRFQDDLAIGTRTLGPGTYWLALRDFVDVNNRYWETTGVGHGNTTKFDNGAGWHDTFDESAFQLTTTAAQVVTPEPASVVFLSTGLVALLAATATRRRRA